LKIFDVCATPDKAAAYITLDYQKISVVKSLLCEGQFNILSNVLRPCRLVIEKRKVRDHVMIVLKITTRRSEKSGNL